MAHRFRLMYFICTDKQVLTPNLGSTTAYATHKYGEAILKQNPDYNRTTHYMWEDDTKPVPKQTVEAFYLVPAALFDKILKPHTLPDMRVLPNEE